MWRTKSLQLVGVFPTPVGMVRHRDPDVLPEFSFPHARGDGPRKVPRDGGEKPFSPRPWGWSGSADTARRRCTVFPTPVGMVRLFGKRKKNVTSFPHARGDGPRTTDKAPNSVRFSPRPWGWSVAAERGTIIHQVFPTPVGMVRGRNNYEHRRTGFPHARGDGPSNFPLHASN